MNWIENSHRNPLSCDMDKPPEACLYNAILMNDLEEVKRILSEGANPNQTIKHGKTCLGEAASMGDTSIVKLLIDHTKMATESTISIHGNVRKRHLKTHKRKMREEQYAESVVKCKTLCDENYYLDFTKLSSKTDQKKKHQNQGYFVLIHDEGSRDESPVPSLISPVSPPSLTSSPLAELEWDEEIGNVAPPTSEDETWSSMYQWYASILESTGAAIASASAVTCGINQQDAFMRTALHYAAEQGHSDIVKMLIDAGCKLDVPACNGLTPLHIAVLWENTEIVQLLLNAGCQVDYTTHEIVTALHFAASRGFLDLVKILVKAGANLESKDTNERTPLFLAVSSGFEDVVDFLISAGADFNGEEIHGYTPICEAVWERHHRVVEVLLKAGARVSHSHRLLHNAVSQQAEEIVTMLADVGCGVNLHNDAGDTPFLLAVRLVMPKSARILLERGANVNACNTITGANALHIAVECAESPEDFQMMLLCYLEYGIDMNATALTGDTPLCRALLLRKDQSAALLIIHGVDVNACDLNSCGMDNLAIASWRTTHNIANILLKAGHTMPVPDSDPIPKNLQGCAATWLREACRHPLCLIDLCRIKVRQQRQKQTMLQYIESLPLPVSLKNFLIMDDEYSFYGYRKIQMDMMVD